MTKKLMLLTCATSALGLWAGVGHAATATANASADTTNQGATSVTELLVTAQRREQSLQKVPVAVSVFTGAQRDTIGINTVADVTNFAPGFTYDPGNVHAFIRGLGRQSVNVTDDQRVANYEDEFYVYSPYGLDKSSLFLSQEQIERGPQNVGGRNAAAGSIDMISVRPTDTPYAEVRATIANYGTYNVEAAASGQVAPGLDLRLAGFDKNQNTGYFTNVLGGPSEGSVVHEWYVEGQLDYKPNDKFEFWARAFAEGWNNRGDAGSKLGFDNGSWEETVYSDPNAYIGGSLLGNPNYGFSAPNGNPTAFAAVQAFNNATFAANPTAACPLCLVSPVVTSATFITPGILNNPSANNPYTYAGVVPRNVKLTNYNDFNYNLTYHFDGFDFKYSGGVQAYDYYLNDNGDGADSNTNIKSFTLLDVVPGGTPLTVYPLVEANYVEDDWWTDHDFSLQSTGDGPLQWTGGLFYYFQHYNQPYSVSDPLQPQLANPICVVAAPGFCGQTTGTAAPNPAHYVGYFQYQFNVQTISPYAQVAWKINDEFKITADLRYTSDDKTGTENARYVSFLAAQQTGVNVVGGTGCVTGVNPAGSCVPAYAAAGVNTPSVDVTDFVICSSGTLTAGVAGTGNLTNPGCSGTTLARGVRSAAVIEPNGDAHRELGIATNAFTGGVDLDWQPTPDIFTYARYGRGYESPSFNAGQVVANPASNPEYLNAYEIGYKQTFGKALLINIAAFYYDYDQLQVPLAVSNGGVTSSQFINVPKAVSEGVEFEAYWTPITDMLVTLSYSYDHTAVLTGCAGSVNASGVFIATANSFCVENAGGDPGAILKGSQPVSPPGAIVLQSVKGDPLPNAPANKFAVDVAYTWHFDPGSLTLSGDYYYRGQQNGSLFNTIYDRAPAWDGVDIRALWKGPNDKYEVIGYVKNVFNSLQYTTGAGAAFLQGSATAIGPNEVQAFELNPPRTFGVEVRYKFF